MLGKRVGDNHGLTGNYAQINPIRTTTKYTMLFSVAGQTRAVNRIDGVDN